MTFAKVAILLLGLSGGRCEAPAFTTDDEGPKSRSTNIGPNITSKVGSDGRGGDAHDPLAKFLYNLVLHLVDIPPQTQSGITFTVSNATCSKIQVGTITPEVSRSSDGSGASFTASIDGVGAHCTMHFQYQGFLIVSGSGDVDATVKTGSSVSMKLDLTRSSPHVPVPDTVDANPANCNVALQFDLKFSGTIIQSVLNLFSGVLAGQIASTAKDQICTQLTEIAQVNMTDALRMFNKIMIPSSTPASARTVVARRLSPVHMGAIFADRLRFFIGTWGLPKGPPRTSASLLGPRLADAMPTSPALGRSIGHTIDWTKVTLLRWSDWFFNNILDPERVNALITDALKSSDTIRLPGPSFALTNLSIEQPSAGMHLNIAVYMDELRIAGVNAIRNFTSLRAPSPSDLEFGIGFGVDERPNWTLSLALHSKIEAVDSSGSSAPQTVVEAANLSLGLVKPGIFARLKILLDAVRVAETYTVAQWFFDTKNCATSLLEEAPAVDMLNLEFSGLASPLKYDALTSGRLESDMSSVFNELVDFFNMFYQPYLPEAITRIAGSPDTLETLNSQIKQAFKPSTCMDPATAATKATTLPQNYSDWPHVFNNKFTRMIDNAVDGFLKKNTTAFVHGFDKMPPIRVPPKEVPPLKTDIEVGVKVHKLKLDGLNKITSIRLLEANETDPTLLVNNAHVTCPTKEKPWRPRSTVSGVIIGGKYENPGDAVTELPCGNFDLGAHVVLDIHQLMALTIPPRPECLLLPFSNMTIQDINFSVKGLGDFILQPTSGPLQRPLSEFEIDFPETWALVLHGVSGKKISSEGANNFINRVRERAAQQCSGPRSIPLPTLPGGLTGADTNLDSYGNPYWNTSIGMWVSTAIVSLLLAVISTWIASRDGKALAAVCWKPTISAKVKTVLFSLLLSVTLVFQILAGFFLPSILAQATVEVNSFGGGEVANVYIASFTFLGTAQHFWQSGAILPSILWTAGALVLAIGITVILFLLWLTPVMASWRRHILRVCILMGRAASLTIPTVVLAHAAMEASVSMPLGVTLDVSTPLLSGMYVGALSTLFMLMSCQCLLGVLPDPQPQPDVEGATSAATTAHEVGTQSFYSRFSVILKNVAWATLLIGTPLWCFFNFVSVKPTHLVGTLLPPVTRNGVQLLGDSNAFQVMFLALTMFIAPLAQLLTMGPWFNSESSSFMLNAIREFGNTFACVDILAAVYFTAYLEAMSPFATHAIELQFKDVCDLIEKVVGVRCLALDIRVSWVGGVGLICAFFGSFMLISIHCMADIKLHARRGMDQLSQEALQARAGTSRSQGCELPQQDAETFQSVEPLPTKVAPE